MGYTSSDDPYRPIRLKFPDRESAVEFAERQDWRYFVREDVAHRHAPDRWRGEERHRPGIRHRLTLLPAVTLTGSPANLLL